MPGKGKARAPLPGSAEERKKAAAYKAEMAQRKAEEEKLAAEAAQAAALVAEQERQAQHEENVRLEKIRVANEAKKNAELAEWTKAQAKAFKESLTWWSDQAKAELNGLGEGSHHQENVFGHTVVVENRRMLKTEY
jgi:membrane protein involved in colicin uptake